MMSRMLRRSPPLWARGASRYRRRRNERGPSLFVHAPHVGARPANQARICRYTGAGKLPMRADARARCSGAARSIPIRRARCARTQHLCAGPYFARRRQTAITHLWRVSLSLPPAENGGVNLYTRVAKRHEWGRQHLTATRMGCGRLWWPASVSSRCAGGRGSGCAGGKKSL
ncbi:hypothetical protein DFH06DRAFT_708046 [Mycena polygramma]|nr:hypothetical protein DFH06DRAFT_708046 [Mycena polygramma]